MGNDLQRRQGRKRKQFDIDVGYAENALRCNPFGFLLTPQNCFGSRALTAAALDAAAVPFPRYCPCVGHFDWRIVARVIG